MKIGELARRTGLSVHTIRYYEQIGLIPSAARDGSGQRVYRDDTLVWTDFLARLKTTGMPIQQMVRYAELRAAGPATAPARRVLLCEHREAVRAHLAELQACLLVLDHKIDGYADTTQENDHDTDLEHARAGRKPLRTRAARTR
jgi:DNA-binding transcriptional MerR regulator